jgi:hypothetical protein
MNLRFGAEYITTVPSVANFVVVEYAASTHSNHLMDDRLLESLILPLRHFIGIPFIILVYHGLGRFGIIVIGISLA